MLKVLMYTLNEKYRNIKINKNNYPIISAFFNLVL